MKKKMVVGILLGILFFYLAVRNIKFHEVIESFRSIRYVYLVPVYMTMLAMHLLRAYRWGILLRPIERIRFVSLVSITSVGFLAIMAVPVRVGELARPYLIKRSSSIKMSSALGTIIIERLFDIFSILVMFSAVACIIPIPQWIVRSSMGILALVVLGMIFISVLVLNRRRAGRIIRVLLLKMPRRLSLRIEEMIVHFTLGLELMTDITRLLGVAALSFIIWTIGAFAIYLLFFAFNFSLPLIAAFAVLVLVTAGISIPAAPGFVGNWHYFCVLALTFFSIPKADAMAFAIVHNFLSVSLTVVMGLLFLPFVKK